jgi:hypothetical protein
VSPILPRPIDPTEHEIEAWKAYLRAGSMRRAALELGVHEITVRKRIAALRDLYNVRTNAQLADVLARRNVA